MTAPGSYRLPVPVRAESHRERTGRPRQSGPVPCRVTAMGAPPLNGRERSRTLSRPDSDAKASP